MTTDLPTTVLLEHHRQAVAQASTLPPREAAVRCVACACPRDQHSEILAAAPCLDCPDCPMFIPLVRSNPSRVTYS
jgi:hypothetical protein